MDLSLMFLATRSSSNLTTSLRSADCPANGMEATVAPLAAGATLGAGVVTATARPGTAAGGFGTAAAAATGGVTGTIAGAVRTAGVGVGAGGVPALTCWAG